MGVFGDEVLLEEAVGASVGRGGEADQEGVEVFEDLPPEVVDRAVALIDDDEVEELGRDLVVVDDGERLLARSDGSRRGFRPRPRVISRPWRMEYIRWMVEMQTWASAGTWEEASRWVV